MKNSVKLYLLLFGLTLMSCEKAPVKFTDVSTLRLVWNGDPTTTASLVWDSKTKTDAIIYYGEKDRGRKFKKYPYSKKPYRTLDYYDMNTQYIKLDNLKPDQAYYFVIKDSRGVSERYWFRTAPDKPKAFTFVAGGDTKSSGDALEAGRSSNRIVAALRPLFVLFSGDITSGNGTDPENWKTWLTDWSTLTTTADGRLIPIVQVQGNHEGGNMANLNIIFDTPFQQNDSFSIYYSWSLGGDFFHLIALNSQIEQGGKQKEWLENDLITHQTYTFKVAAYHKPIWPHTSRKRENVYLYKQWAFLFYKYGLDISFDADSHMHKIMITADYDKEAELHTYFKDVEPLQENNLFNVPKGLKIFQNEKGKDFISYPYH